LIVQHRISPAPWIFPLQNRLHAEFRCRPQRVPAMSSRSFCYRPPAPDREGARQCLSGKPARGSRQPEGRGLQGRLGRGSAAPVPRPFLARIHYHQGTPAVGRDYIVHRQRWRRPLSAHRCRRLLRTRLPRTCGMKTCLERITMRHGPAALLSSRGRSASALTRPRRRQTACPANHVRPKHRCPETDPLDTSIHGHIRLTK